MTDTVEVVSSSGLVRLDHSDVITEVFAKSVLEQVKQPIICAGWRLGRRFVFHDDG